MDKNCARPSALVRTDTSVLKNWLSTECKLCHGELHVLSIVFSASIILALCRAG